jgi:hypothetical protein
MKVTKHFTLVKVVSKFEKCEISADKLIEEVEVKKYAYKSEFFQLTP